MSEDNDISHILIKDLRSQTCKKHNDIIHYHIQGLIEEEEVEMELISSSSIFAYNLIKALSIGSFKILQDQ